jgi:hypothetical protein
VSGPARQLRARARSTLEHDLHRVNRLLERRPVQRKANRALMKRKNTRRVATARSAALPRVNWDGQGRHLLADASPPAHAGPEAACSLRARCILAKSASRASVANTSHAHPPSDVTLARQRSVGHQELGRARVSVHRSPHVCHTVQAGRRLQPWVEARRARCAGCTHDNITQGGLKSQVHQKVFLLARARVRCRPG